MASRMDNMEPSRYPNSVTKVGKAKLIKERFGFEGRLYLTLECGHKVEVPRYAVKRVKEHWPCSQCR